MAEIRSVGINPEQQGAGQGRALIDHMLLRAQELELERVIVLTRVPDFFAKHGFTELEKELLPEKVIKDCEGCPKKEACDEIAMEFKIQ